MARKKTGEWRPYGDYRKLNEKTKPDKYPPPLMEDLFNMLDGKKIFTTLDLFKAYHQIPIHEADIPKTAIITSFGLFEFVVMPFGLKCTFQRYVDSVLRGLEFVYCYVDDIIIASEKPKEHLEHIRIVFDKLEENGLKISLSKCNFGQ